MAVFIYSLATSLNIVQFSMDDLLFDIVLF